MRGGRHGIEDRLDGGERGIVGKQQVPRCVGVDRIAGPGPIMTSCCPIFAWAAQVEAGPSPWSTKSTSRVSAAPSKRRGVYVRVFGDRGPSGSGTATVLSPRPGSGKMILMCAAGPDQTNDARSLPPNVIRRIRGLSCRTAATVMRRGLERGRFGRSCWVTPSVYVGTAIFPGMMLAVARALRSP